jgi:N-acetyl-gamma-glutamyl-phosphate reductase
MPQVRPQAPAGDPCAQGLTRRPIFVPQVGPYAQGMIVQVPLHLAPGGVDASMEALKAHYGTGGFVEVVDRDTLPDRIDPQCLNGTNRMLLTVDGDRKPARRC